MKKVLSLLLAFVFFQTETWALSGGPVFTGASGTNFIGTYAGFLVPVFDPAATVDPAATSVGLFSLSQAEVGAATGGLVVFVNGTAFNGTITGLIDEKDGTFRGIIDATSTFNVVQFVPVQSTTNGTVTTTLQRQEFPVFAQGTMLAEVNKTDKQEGITTQVAVPTRIDGTAILNVSFNIADDGTPIINSTSTYEVDGFKQSDTASGAATFSVGSNLNTGGGTTTGG